MSLLYHHFFGDLMQLCDFQPSSWPLHAADVFVVINSGNIGNKVEMKRTYMVVCPHLTTNNILYPTC